MNNELVEIKNSEDHLISLKKLQRKAKELKNVLDFFKKTAGAIFMFSYKLKNEKKSENISTNKKFLCVTLCDLCKK